MLTCPRQTGSFLKFSNAILARFGTRKRVHYERGLFTRGISRISKMATFSRISRKSSASPFIFSQSEGSLKFLESPNSLESLEMVISEKTTFQKTHFSEREGLGPSPGTKMAPGRLAPSSDFSLVWRLPQPSWLLLIARKVRYFQDPCDRDPPTENLQNSKFFQNSRKILNVYFRGDNVYLWGVNVDFWGDTVYFWGSSKI